MSAGDGVKFRPGFLMFDGVGFICCPAGLLPAVDGRSDRPAGLLSAVDGWSASPALLLSAVVVCFRQAALFYLVAVADADAVVVLHEAGEAAAEVLVVFLLGAAPLYFAHGAESGQ